MANNKFGIAGLSDEQVKAARAMYGDNQLRYKKERTFLQSIGRILREPMIVLLLAASAIYFISGKPGDGLFLAGAIIFQASISLFQDSRSKNALEKLKALSRPGCKVIRNGAVIEIKSDDIVVGDSLVVEEGAPITADGTIIYAHDFSVNESILTGESLPVFKDKVGHDNQVFRGTNVASGLAAVTVTAVGNDTKLGSIGKSLESIAEEKTPLETQIANFVKWMAVAGAVVFLLVWIINYLNSGEWLKSLLQALTLAMSILPEEIPVAFTTFMAMGAWRLMKMGIVVKQMKTVETLGSATVICVDKTGTLTENRMSLAKVFVLSLNRFFVPADQPTREEKDLITAAMWASEPVPFDPMEKALHESYSKIVHADERPSFRLTHEYPLEGKPPMMTHVFADEAGKQIIAAKGAPEALMNVSGLTEAQRQHVTAAIAEMAGAGFRILGVGISDFKGDAFPAKQQDLPFQFIGLVAFYDPPKSNIAKVMQDFYSAGITVKIITGDNALTTAAIARQIGFAGVDSTMSGEELMKLTDPELENRVSDTAIFTRMFPDAKLRIINALKSGNQVVAMTGDGVNDGPALKAAHIGIAMGKRGTDIARDAASLILMEDDLGHMVNAVAMGRKIYGNLKKAVQYIISIHIPIILTVFIPLVLGWIYPNIFSPIHVIFLELIMGPTCSIIYENEPLEKDAMFKKPKAFTTRFFSWRELSTSIIQGLVITAGVLFIYQYSVSRSYNEAVTRTMVFTALVTANIFLTLVNRSFYYSVLTTFSYKNNLIFLILALTVALSGLILYFKPVNAFFEFQVLAFPQLMLCVATGFFSVTWYEIVKLLKRRNESGK